MTDLDSMSLFIQKPRKPQKADTQLVNYAGNSPESKAVHTRVNYLMEMMKFFPDYERKMYAGDSADDIVESMNQYAEPEQTHSGITPTFGDVVRSMTGTVIRANRQGAATRGLQFDDKAVADYEHLDNQTLETVPVTEGLSSGLWAKAKAALQNETNSYYDIVMKNKLAEYSPEKAFYLMVSMLESRSRIYAAMGDIYGTPDMSGSQRQAVFNRWYAENKGSVTDGEIGFLKFFLDLQQSFVAHTSPLAGGSSEQILSSLDQTKSENFFTTLSEKVGQYLADNPDLAPLWNAWINPTVAVTPEQNTDPLTDIHVKGIYETLSVELEKLIGASIGSKSVSRSQMKTYTQEMEAYEQEVDDEKKTERDEERNLQKKQAEDKALFEKIAAQNRAQQTQTVKQETKAEKAKPAYVAKTKSAMANKVSIRTQPNAASVPMAARAMVRRPVKAASSSVAGASNQAAASTAKRRPLAMAAKPLSAKSSKIISATVSNLFKGKSSKTNSAKNFVKRQPKSKLSVS